MKRLTEKERQLITSALDSHRTVLAAGGALAGMGSKATKATRELMTKLQDMDLIMYPKEADPKLTPKETAAIREHLSLDDEHEVDDDLLLSVADDGVWVNSWDWVYMSELPIDLRRKLWPDQEHEDE